jgi:hypothetical protein
MTDHDHDHDSDHVQALQSEWADAHYVYRWLLTREGAGQSAEHGYKTATRLLALRGWTIGQVDAFVTNEVPYPQPPPRVRGKRAYSSLTPEAMAALTRPLMPRSHGPQAPQDVERNLSETARAWISEHAPDVLEGWRAGRHRGATERLPVVENLSDYYEPREPF